MNLFEKRRARFGNFAAGGGAAGKRDGVDLRMRSNRRADIRPRAMNDIENAIWQTGFARDFAEHEAVIGVNSLGFAMAVLPTAMAGAIFQLNK